MKFKIIFILFNIVVVFSFLIVTMMPFMMLGAEYSRVFFKDSWYFFLLFVLTIGSIDAYFLLNWKLFTLLESENWDELISYLENRIYRKKNLYGYLVRILANTYLIKSNIDGISRLEELLRKEKPKTLKKMVLPICIPHLIGGDAEKMEVFFGEFLEEKGVRKADWVRFLYSFSLLLNNKRKEASNSLLTLCKRKVSPILQLLIIYALNPFTEMVSDEDFSCVELRKKELLSKYSKLKMELELERVNDNVVTLVLNKFSKEAIQWLYKE
ncbi:MAG: hypothetical protein KAR21_10805 [Spirochaetales bacterium]|nr:hypothetical protein [Spirochaetales bacterium]